MVLAEGLQPLETGLADRFRFVRQVGRGGWGIVFLVDDLKQQRQAAIKVLRIEMASTKARLRFLREIDFASRLDHANILPLYESGEHDGILYYVMPFVAGESLEQRLKRERQRLLPIGEALRIAGQIARALSHAHDKGIIHRDIKPGNVLLDGERVVVTDFGIARAIIRTSPTEWVSTRGQQVGTPDYMSPEQATAEADLDGRSDIYSLGCVLYEMLAGHPPFTASSPSATMARHAMDPVPSLRTVRPAVSDAIENVVVRALAKKPADRFANADEMAVALEAVATGTYLAPLAPARSRARRWIVGATAIGAIAAAAAMWRMAANARARLVSEADTTRYAVLPFERDSAIPAAFKDGQFVRDALQHWQGLSVVDEAAVREALPRSALALTPAEARAVALRLRAGRYVEGNLVRDAGVIRVSARLYEASGGKLSEATERVTASGGTDSAFARVVDRLLFRGVVPTARVEPRVGTNSLPARQAYLAAHANLEQWNLLKADSLFDAATRLGGRPGVTYAQAALWLATVRFWRALGVPRWGYLADAAAAGRDQLAPREQTLTDAIVALSKGDFPRACTVFDGLATREPIDFAVWYSAGACRYQDRIVVRDAASPTGYRFRSSYQAAIVRFRRAFELQPSILAALRENGFERVRSILKTSGNDLRPGRLAPPETTTFVGYASLRGDSLLIVPVPTWRLQAAGVPSTMPDAVRRQRELFRDIATTWVAAYPRSAAAFEALAIALQLLGDGSALDTLRHARALAGPEERVSIAASQVLMRIKFSLPGDLSGLRAARILADSLLRTAAPTADEARVLVGLAILTGRVGVADALARALPDSVASRVPAPLNAIGRSLLVYAAAGAPRDSIRALELRADSAIERVVPAPMKRQAATQILSRPAILAFPEYRFATLDSLGPTGGYLVRALVNWTRGDTAAVLTAFKSLHDARASVAPADLAIDGLFPEAWLLDQAGQTQSAIETLDPWLASLRITSPLGLASAAQAGALMRSMVLRAELAARVGDRAGAARWAGAVAELWSGGDASLQPVVRRMNELRGSR